MQLKNAVWVLVLAVGISASKVLADEVQRLRTVFITFPPTLVNDTEVQTEIVRGVTDGAQYQPLPHPQSPFRLSTGTNIITARNGELVLTALFKPEEAGQVSQDIFLVRLPVTSADTIRLRLTGLGYSLERMEYRFFGQVHIGDSASTFVRARSGLARDESWRFVPEQLPPPFYQYLPGPPTQVRDTAFFLFTFKPEYPGPFRDTSYIQRLSGSDVVETIMVILHGVGINESRIENLDFGTLLTGDTTARIRVLQTPVARSNYQLLYRPAEPFRLYVNAEGKPIPVPPDSILVGAAFKPTHSGVFKDSIVIVRMSAQQKPVDTITVYLFGTSVTQTPRLQAAFSGLNVLDSAEQQVFVEFPVQPSISFEYAIHSETQEPARVSMGSVVTKGIPLTVTATPRTYTPSATQTFVIRRLHAGAIVDSTILSVVTSMRPRPIAVVLAADTVQGNIGDTVTVTLRCFSDDTLDTLVTITDFDATIGYNPTVFAPIPDDQHTVSFSLDSASINIRRSDVIMEPGSAETTVATIRGIIAMGDASATTLAVSSEPSGVKPDIIRTWTNASGRIDVLNVWSYGNGTPRYVNPLKGALSVTIVPNPVVNRSVLRIENVQEEKGRVVISTITGQRIADLTPSVRSGVREWTVGSGSGSDVVLPRGTYFVNLTMTGVSGTEIFSVTRQFIVE